MPHHTVRTDVYVTTKKIAHDARLSSFSFSRETENCICLIEIERHVAVARHGNF